MWVLKNSSKLRHLHTLRTGAELTAAPLCTQIDLIKGMVDCLYAECKPCITECVMAELEKLGAKYRVALKIAKVRRHRCPISMPSFLPL